VLLTALSATSIVACSAGAGGGQTTTSRGSTTTTTTASSTTTTTVRSSTTADANAEIAKWAASREGSVDVSIGNLGDGTVADVTPGPQATVRIASLMKVSIAIAFLRLRHDQGRAPTEGELVELGLMIEASDNHYAQVLWDESGGSRGLSVTAADAGLTHTAYQPRSGWGFALTNAHDQALLATALARGRMLSPGDTQLLLALMRNVQPNQNWGFADTVASSLKPAVKDGWYEDKDQSVWRVHCMAIFDSPALAHPFSIVVTTRYPAKLGIEYGQDTCRGVGRRLGAWLASK
jgi:hypothetical protein